MGLFIRDGRTLFVHGGHHREYHLLLFSLQTLNLARDGEAARQHNIIFSTVFCLLAQFGRICL